MAEKEPTISQDTWFRSAQIVYPELKEWEKFARGLQTSYSKWLITTLYVVHAGAITGLIFKSPYLPPAYLPAIWCFVAGLLLASIAGFAAWVNLCRIEELYGKWADYHMLIAPGQDNWPKAPRMYRTSWPKGHSLARWINRSQGAAVLAGLASGACIPLGAFFVWLWI
jgi:hypothetical protein